jgi:outer membrane receptor protein involved in Fe transport
VSQPGSATDGETFLMRGLLGNTYAKILINDVPVKPTYLASMPIGAQLPIKEAERIEIIYGAGTAIYGSDGASGVINIITRESDKPVFMQADLAVGSGVYSSVNVMFGGRLGRDKRILKYFAYGSNVIMEDRRIFYDTSNLYRPSRYTDNKLHSLFPNYGGGEPDNPVLTSTPHLSRKFGFNLKYKRFTLSGETMYRRDHSALGFNPVAVSYRNPLTFTGESILRFNLNIYKDKGKHNRKTDITYFRYKLDGRSSILWVNNSLTKMLYQSAVANANLNNNDSTIIQYFNGYYDQYVNGLRYMYANSDEFRVEHVRNYVVFKSATLTLGANTKHSSGTPFTGLFRRPVLEGDGAGFQVDYFQLGNMQFSTIYPNSGGVNESNVFGQLFYNGKKLKLAGGFNYTLFGIGLGEHFYGDYKAFSPRVSGLWEFGDNVNIRSAFGTAFRPPNPYYEANSYAVFSNSPKILYRPEQLPIVPEKTTSWESGIRWKSDAETLAADLTWFLNKTNNLIRFGKREIWLPDSTRYFGQLDYSNFVNNSIRFTGGQASIFFTNEINGRKSNGLISYSWLNYKNDELRTLNEGGLAAPPKGRIWQFRNNFNPFKNSVAILDIIRYKEIATTGGSNPKSKLWTFDITWRYAFTDRFDGYLKIINLFNKKYSGILPEGDPEDLLRYNPQSGFFLRLGMNYNIE